MASSTSLPDDILIEIFTCLPLNLIYKFKCLSKVWLANLSNPNFIIKWFQINHKSLPWILYHTIEDFSGFRKIYDESHSEFVSRYEHLFSFKFLMNEKPFQGARLYLHGSSNGLVLCQSVHSDGQSRYHVCNPLTQKWVSIPSPPDSAVSHHDINAFFCEYSSSFSSCYTVVHIPVSRKCWKKFNVDIFSSDLGVWKSFEVSCDKEAVLQLYANQKVIILNRVLYFIEGRYRLLICNLNQINESDEHRCSLIDFPVEENDDDEANDDLLFDTFYDYDDDNYMEFNSILGESEGRIGYVRTRITRRKLTVSVWVLDNVNWQLLHNKVSIRGGVLAEMLSWVGKDIIQVLGLSPVDRNVVLLGWRYWIWGLNLQTRNVEELCFDRGHVHDEKMFRPFVLTPMPTVLPLHFQFQTEKE